MVGMTSKLKNLDSTFGLNSSPNPLPPSSPPQPVPQGSRFASLAAKINSWEDESKDGDEKQPTVVRNVLGQNLIDQTNKTKINLD
jgi:hypothetical protein